MAIRNVKDAKDLASDELIYFRSHAKATYMSDGATVEDTINAIANNIDNIQAPTESQIAAMGFTKNTGTITGIKMNGVSKGSSGIVDLGTVITTHQDISGKADKSSLAKVATSGSYNDLTNKPTIPSQVTESTVSGWGFTKNTGTYTKPSGGIPKTDLASGVQNTLDAIGSYGVIIDDINADVAALYENKQDTLVSGNTIKTINGESILGSGNIVISGGGSSSESGEVYITPFTVEQFCNGYTELTDEQRNELLNAASQNRIIGMPYGVFQAGYVIADYQYSFSNDIDTGYWELTLGVIDNGAHYSNYIGSYSGLSDFVASRRTITPFKPLIYTVDVEDGVAIVSDDSSYTDNCVFAVGGECSELCVYLEPSEIGKTVRFFTGESCTLEIGAYVCWANGEVPTIEPYTQYELSLVVNIDYGFNAVLTPFKPVE